MYPKPNKWQRGNLIKLANYLDTLPATTPTFSMRSYFESENNEAGWSAPITVKPSSYGMECGTIACAVGHGPAAGIKPNAKDIGWNEYCLRVFGIEANSRRNSPFWRLFDDHNPNLPHRIAAKIREYVAEVEIDAPR